MNKSGFEITWMFLFLGLLWSAHATFTLSFPNGTVFSDVYTLTPGVTYTVNMTFPTIDIPGGSTVAVKFGYRFNINSTTLANC